MPIKTAAIYLRVSTRDQSFASQERELKDYCRRRGWKNMRVYSEKASGAKAARTVLDMMMQDARAGRIDTIVVYKIDRLGRSITHLLQIVGELARLKIGLIATSQGIDTNEGSSVGDLQLNLMAAFAQFEREMIRERTLSGVASARKAGKVLGRPKTDPAVIDLIHALRKKKVAPSMRPFTYKEIAERAKVSIGLVWRILNPAAKKTGK